MDAKGQQQGTYRHTSRSGAVNSDESEEADVDESGGLLLEGRNPIAWGKLVGSIAELEEVYIVDPYLHAEHLAQLVEHADVNRVLTPVVPNATAHVTCSASTCMIEADFLEKVGFEVVAPHHRFPRLRLELDRDHGWKQDVESALEQLLIAASISVVDIEQKSTVGAR